MAVTAGELFVNLGIKGADKTIGALTNVEKGLKGIFSLSLESKAALLGAAYALEQLMSNSARYGTDITNVAAELGVLPQVLQRYQYAARMVGDTNEDVVATFKTLQKSATDTLFMGKSSDAMSYIGSRVGGFTKKDLERYQSHPEEFLQRLSDYAHIEGNTGLRNEMLKKMGISDNMISALMRNAFTPQKLAQAPTYSNKEIKSLDAVRSDWTKLQTQIEMAFGRFTAAHGRELIKDLGEIVKQLIRMGEEMTIVAEKFSLFEKFGNIIKGLANSFKLLLEVMDVMAGKQLKKGDILYGKEMLPGVKDSPLMKLFQGKENPGNFFDEIFKDFHSDTLDNLKDVFKKSANPPGAGLLRALPGGGPTSQNNIEINQQLNFQHAGDDATKLAAASKEAISRAYRQSWAQIQVT